MKKHFIVLMTLFAIIATSCSGDQGPPGPVGPQGNNGGLIVSKAFEIQIDFNATNNYQFTEAYGFEVFPSDVTLVYIKWETVNGQAIWRLLPQTVQFAEGTLVYNFDFTRTDVRFFLESNLDLSLLNESYTQDQVFRVVVIPADNVDGMDLSNLNDVMSHNNITDFEQK